MPHAARKTRGLGRRTLLPLLGLGLATATAAYAVQHGARVKAGAWPAVVALVDRGTQGAGIFGTELKGTFCTGTLIRPRIVLTAAHCVTQAAGEQARTDLLSQVSIYRGEGRLNYLGPVSGQVRVLDARIHPDSGTGTDLALLALEQPLPGVEPLDLDFTPATANQDIVSVGFGELQPGESRNTMGQKSEAPRKLDFLAGKDLCSRRAGRRTPSSAGDSGGPALVRSASGAYRLLGVLTGFRTQHQGSREVEVDCWIPVAAHQAWLEKNIAALAAQPAPSRP